MWLLIMPAAAHAHARLTASIPAADATQTTTPREIMLTFSGPISVGPHAVQVFTPSGTRIDRDTARLEAGDTRVVQALATDNASTGSYAVGWRVTSRDGHTIRGSFLYTVGSATARDPSKALEQAHKVTRVGSRLEVAAAVTRGIGFLALLGAAGSVLFGTLIAPRVPVRGVGAMLGVLLGALAATYVIDAALSNGVSLMQALTPSMLAVEAGHPYGRGALVTGALAVLGFVVLPILTRSPAGAHMVVQLIPASVFAALAASASLSGHAMAADPLLARLSLDMLHMIAAATWIGGLLQLCLVTPVAGGYVTEIIRFSRTALVCVGLLVGTGLYATWHQLGLQLSALDAGSYGHILLAKLLLFVTTIPMAALNMSTLVPALRTHPDEASPILRSYVTREGIVLIGIVALTAWLTGTDPRA